MFPTRYQRQGDLSRITVIKLPYATLRTTFSRLGRQRASVHLSYLGALRTARPTFQFPFECPGVGRAVCPQAAAKNSFLDHPTHCGHALDLAFFSLLPFKPPSRLFGRAVGTSMEKWNEVIRKFMALSILGLQALLWIGPFLDTPFRV